MRPRPSATAENPTSRGFCVWCSATLQQRITTPFVLHGSDLERQSAHLSSAPATRSAAMIPGGPAGWMVTHCRRSATSLPNLTLNPLTVLKGYQQLVDEGARRETARTRHVRQTPGARAQLSRRTSVSASSRIDWPRVLVTIERLGLDPAELLQVRAKSRRLSEGTPLPFRTHEKNSPISFTASTKRVVPTFKPRS